MEERMADNQFIIFQLGNEEFGINITELHKTELFQSVKKSLNALPYKVIAKLSYREVFPSYKENDRRIFRAMLTTNLVE